MSRLAAAAAVGFERHITQCGNNRRDLFFADDGRPRLYLKLLKEQADKCALELIGYCLVLLPCFWASGPELPLSAFSAQE